MAATANRLSSPGGLELAMIFQLPLLTGAACTKSPCEQTSKNKPIDKKNICHSFFMLFSFCRLLIGGFFQTYYIHMLVLVGAFLAGEDCKACGWPYRAEGFPDLVAKDHQVLQPMPFRISTFRRNPAFGCQGSSGVLVRILLPCIIEYIVQGSKKM